MKLFALATLYKLFTLLFLKCLSINWFRIFNLGPVLFFVFIFVFSSVNSKYDWFCRWLEPNRRPQISEGTTLPTEPQPLLNWFYMYRKCFGNWVVICFQTLLDESDLTCSSALQERMKQWELIQEPESWHTSSLRSFWIQVRYTILLLRSNKFCIQTILAWHFIILLVQQRQTFYF